MQLSLTIPHAHQCNHLVRLCHVKYRTAHFNDPARTVHHRYSEIKMGEIILEKAIGMAVSESPDSRSNLFSLAMIIHIKLLHVRGNK